MSPARKHHWKTIGIFTVNVILWSFLYRNVNAQGVMRVITVVWILYCIAVICRSSYILTKDKAT